MMEATVKHNPASGLTADEEKRIMLVGGVDNDFLPMFMAFFNGAQAMAEIYKRKSEAKKEDA